MIEIRYDQGPELLGHGFKNNLIQFEYSRKSRLSKSGNPQANSMIEIHEKVLGNIICPFNLKVNCIDDEYPWKGIL